MVGVPGRSKGCNTCIQRKIKCDQGRPLCGNCKKSNRLCTGYRRKVCYVFSGDVALPGHAGTASDEWTVVNQGRWKGPRSRQQPSAGLLAMASGVVLRERPPPPAPLRTQPSISTALRQQYHHIFLHDHLPVEMRNRGNAVSVIHPNFLVLLQDMVIESIVLKTAMSGFLQARIARKNNDLDLLLQSRSMYTSGLGQLQEAIKNPVTRVSDETLAACVLLSLYELMETPPGQKGSSYRTHQRGAMMLLFLRGPDACASPLGLSIFMGLRVQTVHASLINRHDTLLSQPDWINLPWKYTHKTAADKFVDLLFKVPPIYEQFDLLAAEPSPQVIAASLRGVIAKAMEIASALRALFDDFQKSISGPLYWPELSTLASRLDDPKLGKVFPVSLHFPSFTVAQIVNLYWSGVLAIHYQIMYAYANLAALESSQSELSTTCKLMRPSQAQDRLPFVVSNDERAREHNDVWVAAVKNMFQSVEYFIQSSMGGLGPVTSLTLIRASRTCLEDSFPDEYAREIGWCSEMAERIQSMFGFPVVKIMDG